MPTLREYTSQVQVNRGIDGRRAAPEDQNIGGALTQFGDALNQVTAHYDKLRRESLVDQATLEANSEIQTYAKYLDRGRTNDDGSFEPPPDPLHANRMFQEKVKEVNESMRERIGDDRAHAVFQNNFQKLALPHAIAVQKMALDKQSAQVKADLDDAHLNTADQIAAASDPNVKASLRELVAGQRRRAVTAGVMTELDARKMEKKMEGQIAGAEIRMLIMEDPQKALTALASPDTWRMLPPDQRANWMRIASQELERRTKAAQSHSDPVVHSDLRIRAGRGENVIGLANTAYRNGRLSSAHFSQIMAEVESHQKSGGLPNVHKQWLNYVEKSVTGEKVVSIAERQRAQEAVAEFMNYLRENPKATPADIEATARELVGRAGFMEGNAVNMIPPRFMTRGNITKDSLQQAYLKGKEEFGAGRMTKKEFADFASSVRRWKEYLTREEANSKKLTRPAK